LAWLSFKIPGKTLLISQSGKN